MSETTQQLLNDALRLSTVDRAQLAALLIESLDESPDPGADDAWSVEIEHRLAEIDRGDVSMIPWAEVQKQLRGENGTLSD
jgi:putative addiction module component (TIGR02574 family)